MGEYLPLELSDPLQRKLGWAGQNSTTPMSRSSQRKMRWRNITVWSKLRTSTEIGSNEVDDDYSVTGVEDTDSDSDTDSTGSCHDGVDGDAAAALVDAGRSADSCLLYVTGMAERVNTVVLMGKKACESFATRDSWPGIKNP